MKVLPLSLHHRLWQRLLEFASSIISLIDISNTIVGYLKDVKDAPKERDELNRELSNLTIYLDTVHRLTQTAAADDPWLETVQRLSGPFAQLDELLKSVKTKLEPAPDGPLGKMKQRLLWKFSKESVEDSLKKIERIKSLVLVAVQHDHAALSRAINKTLIIVDTKDDVNLVGKNVVKVSDHVMRIDGELSQIRSNMEKDQDYANMVMRIISGLTDSKFKSKEAETLSQQVVGDTGRLFLESEPFRQWVDGTAVSSRLWFPGDPGVGKTILASIIIDYLRSLPVDQEKKTVILSVFCDFQSEAAKRIDRVLCDFLKQLIRDKGLCSAILLFYSQCLRDGSQPSFSAITNLLSQEMDSFKQVCVVLDALDGFIKKKASRCEVPFPLVPTPVPSPSLRSWSMSRRVILVCHAGCVLGMWRVTVLTVCAVLFPQLSFLFRLWFWGTSNQTSWKFYWPSERSDEFTQRCNLFFGAKARKVQLLLLYLKQAT
ncbi:hypothetical protein F5146DRAFT_1006310 [Armillaria mellea]|nr:hypothetical protein F5146DRAFT_1006310 [Armillaria mellea]